MAPLSQPHDPTESTPDIAEYLTFQPKLSRVFSDSYVFEPESEYERRLGRLFFLIEVGYNTKRASDLADACATVLQETFYDPAHTTFDAAFEAAVAKVNDVLSELAQAGETSWIGKLNAVIAATNQFHIAVTRAGTAQAFVERLGRVLDLTGSIDTSIPDPMKTFPSIVSGEAVDKDQLIIGNAYFFEQVSPMTAGKLTSEFAPPLAVNHIDGMVRDVVEYPVATILASIDTSKAPDVSAMAAAVETMKTESIHSVGHPSIGTPNIDIEHAAGPAHENSASASATTSKTPLKESLPARADRWIRGGGGRLIKASLENSAKGLRAVGLFIGRFFKGAWRVLRKKQSQAKEKADAEKAFFAQHPEPSTVWKEPLPRVRWDLDLQTATTSIATFPQKFKTLPRSSRVFLMLSAVFLLVFVGSFSGYGFTQAQQRKSVAAKTLLDKAELKRQAALSALIYDDQAQAKKLLAEAETIAGQVLGTRFYKTEVTALQSKINEDKHRIDRYLDVKDLEDVATLPESNAQELVLDGRGALISVNPENNHLFATDIAAKSSSTLEVESANIGHLGRAGFYADDNAIYFATDNKGMARFDVGTRKLTSASVDLSGNVEGMASYGRYLYVFVPSANQIYRLSKTTGGFGRPIAWLGDGTDISQGTDMAIDGAVYVVSGNNAMQMLSGGIRTFTLDNPKAPLGTLTRIITSEKMSGIYVLDHDNKRVLKYDKVGTLQKEYTHESFGDLRAFAIDEATGRAYVLNGDLVQSFGL